MIDDINRIKECPDCASMNIVYSISRDQVICKDCGLIFEPLLPEIEEKFEQTHGISTGTTPKKPEKRGRPAKKTSKKPAKKPKSKKKKR